MKTVREIILQLFGDEEYQLDDACKEFQKLLPKEHRYMSGGMPMECPCDRCKTLREVKRLFE